MCTDSITGLAQCLIVLFSTWREKEVGVDKHLQQVRLEYLGGYSAANLGICGRETARKQYSAITELLQTIV